MTAAGRGPRWPVSRSPPFTRTPKDGPWPGHRPLDALRESGKVLAISTVLSYDCGRKGKADAKEDDLDPNPSAVVPGEHPTPAP